MRLVFLAGLFYFYGLNVELKSKATQGLESLSENLIVAHFCSARLQAGILESSRCPPEGGRYINQNGVLTQTLEPRISIRYIVAAKDATHKDDL
jgi:hypothetical protein